jgi:hypothetical protein
MLSKETKEKLQSALLKLGIELPATKVETEVVKLEDVALIDGTMLSVDKMEVGAMASFIGADGMSMPAEGTYELADGTKIMCVAGVITEIMPKEAETEVEIEVSPVNEDMKAILSRLEALEKIYSNKQTNLEAELSETKKGLQVALTAIDAMDKNSVALNLESNNKKTETKNYNELTPLELFKLRKQNKFVG